MVYSPCTWISVATLRVLLCHAADAMLDVLSLATKEWSCLAPLVVLRVAPPLTFRYALILKMQIKKYLRRADSIFSKIRSVGLRLHSQGGVSTPK